MRSYAIAIRPGGNIRATLSDCLRKSLESPGRLPIPGLPEAFYLGFFESGKKARPKLQAKTILAAIWKHLPDRIEISRLETREGLTYACPVPALSDGIVAETAKLGAALGLTPLADPPLTPGLGFLVSGSLPPSGMPHFSFRAMEALLIRLDSGEADFTSVYWRVLAHVWRKKGE